MPKAIIATAIFQTLGSSSTDDDREDGDGDRDGHRAHTITPAATRPNKAPTFKHLSLLKVSAA